MTNKGYETIYITEIINDLWILLGEARLKRLPKNER